MASNLFKNEYLHRFKEEDSEIEELSRIEENELLQSPKFKKLQSSSPPRSNSGSPQKYNNNINNSFENIPILNYVPNGEIPQTPTKPRNRNNLKSRSSVPQLSSQQPQRFNFNTPTKIDPLVPKASNSKVSLTPAQRFEKKPGKLFSSRDILSSYEFKETIGRGAFANVYRAINKITNDEVAIKEIFIEDDDNILELMCEIDLLKILKHKNIVKYHGFIKNDKKLLIFLEYCSGGSLRTLYKKQGPLSEKQVAKYLVQVLEGLKYLHSQGVVHRDVKAANILLTSKGDIKLTDFGVSTKVSSNTIKTYSIAGTPNWMAPEIISMDGTSTASDIWSLGATIVELLTGEPLYSHLNEMAALHAIVTDDSPPIPTFISELCKDFIMKCFAKQPNERISAKELFNHPWLTKFNKKNKSKSNASSITSSSSLERKPSINEFNSIKRSTISKNFLPLDMHSTFKHSEHDLNTFIDNKLSNEFDTLDLNGTSSTLSSPITSNPITNPSNGVSLFRPLEQDGFILSAQKLKKKLKLNPLDIITLKDIIRKLDNDTIDSLELINDGFIYQLSFTINQYIQEFDSIIEIFIMLSKLIIKLPDISTIINNSGIIGSSKNLITKETPSMLRNQIVEFLNTIFDIDENSLIIFIQTGGLFESLNLLEEDFKLDPNLPIFTIRTIRKSFQISPGKIPKDLITFTIFNTPNTIDWIGIFLMVFSQSNHTSAINDVVSIISELHSNNNNVDSSVFKPMFLNSIFKIFDKLSNDNQFKILVFLKKLNLNEISSNVNILKFLINSLDKQQSKKSPRYDFINLICSMIFSCCHLNPENQLTIIKYKVFPIFYNLIINLQIKLCFEFIFPLVCELSFNQSLIKFLQISKFEILDIYINSLNDPVWKANSLDSIVGIYERLGHDESIIEKIMNYDDTIIGSFMDKNCLNFELYLERFIKLLNSYQISKSINQLRFQLFNNVQFLENIFYKINFYQNDLVIRLNLFKLLKVLSEKANEESYNGTSQILQKKLVEIKPTKSLLIDKIIDEILSSS
ncbi:hypothetical protein BN7_5169 [Wickerhamomyces ciferrii]|uniref:non-specific serine/threonine protein kinase n=1 Tax=Wickerhamomyces ciferrii (strain ATCC 14091 / BCRC 22168 / CBS 111 / JCM 3599 / NBRC 0793 / NRRL Y-1031 F-60-10) TaxID=1206466 RepID=K0KR26_WICCF|nr:uncharacterized protein BN7_5169 [Wickerhamomyces ciferrii]CCH45586.1 hypothetical protein BN7_5169 [Wickerhamomyces ciferrii]